MAEENNQGKQQKSQSNQCEKITLNESTKGKGSGDAGGSERLRRGNAGDTENTGPRKK
jgi:hypothetical protein